MKLKIGEKEYSIKFAYKPTLKERIISKFVKYSGAVNTGGGMDLEKMEDLLLFLPEAVLVGLQANHEEFRYDCNTGEGKEEKLEKTFALVEEYMDGDDADVIVFFNQLQEALLQDGFLRSLFQKEQKKLDAENLAIETEMKES